MKKITFSPAVVLAKAGAIILLSLVFFTACNEDKKQADALIIEIQTHHEDAMRGLADMNRVARELKQTMIAAMMNPEQAAGYNEALTAMGKAENNMMDWMKNYKTTEGMPSADAIKYLQEQKALIAKSESEIVAALEAGKKLQGK